MLNGRLYRTAFIPVVLALGLAAFSLSARPLPLTSALAPDAFNGARATAELGQLAGEFPRRAPGSHGDEALAGRIFSQLRALGSTASGGFSVHTRTIRAQTIDGERTLTTVTAQRPGSTSATPIVILAHRDSALGPGASAELSGTAALVEMARVFAARETRRTVILVSTSGGSGGDGGAEDFAARAHGPIDAAIVLGDLAGARVRRPFVVGFSDGAGSAPQRLQRTVSDAITRETGSDPGAPSVAGQLAHLAFHMSVGEQGPLNAAGIPAVLVQVSGERGAARGERVSRERFEGMGRAVLSAVDALDAGPDLNSSMQTDLLVQRQVMPSWVLRMLVGTLLLGPLLVLVDGLARVRRQRSGTGGLRRSVAWSLSCAVPFFATALFARALGTSGAIAGAPSGPIPPNALSLDGGAVRAVLAVCLVLALAWLLWPALLRRLRLPTRPDPELAGLAIGLLMLGLALLAWFVNPFAALLLVPALHLLLLIVSPELRPRAPAALALVLLALLPLVLLVAFYLDQLGLGPGRALWLAVLLLAGGRVGIPAAVLWSIAFGCAAAAGMLALRSRPPEPSGRPQKWERVSVRGPVTYAGPGSLGGTESALRR